jgi:ABC-type molybdenum transport system ATPase subunit/photorepair protein PhrA
VILRWRAKDSDDVARALDLLGLDAVADRPPSTLSQAERKSVALARAIVARPALLMLDEPAAGLDRLETEELGDRLRQVAGSGPALCETSAPGRPPAVSPSRTLRSRSARSPAGWSAF